MNAAMEQFTGLPDVPAIAELKSRRQWVAWRYLERDGNITKPPVNPHNGYGASHSDPSTWGTYDEASEYARKHSLPGVGYVLTDDDDISGADLDKCRDDEFGGIEEWAAAIVRMAETYTEISPSGRGLRLIWRGKIAETIKCDPAHVEVYKHKRYLTITGNHVAGTPLEIREAPQTEKALRSRVEKFRPAAPASSGIVAAALAQVAKQTSSGPIVQLARAGGDFFRSVNSEAMQNLAQWVPDLFGSMAEYQPTTRAWRVSSRNLGRNLQEDLSIAPTGIVDFGVHDMGDPRLGKRTPIDLVLEFGTQRTAADAAKWLCERVGRSPASLGWQNGHSETTALAIFDATQPTDPSKPLILSSAEFVAGFKPPEYGIDGMLQKSYLYALTARTGHGKTAVGMYMGVQTARGRDFHGRAVKQGSVLFLAGENPDDVRARYLVLADHEGFDPATIPFYFIDGVIDIAAAMPRIQEEAAKIPNLSLVIVDTAAAYFRGDDGNSNTQQGAYARLLRQLTFLPGKPMCVVPCHPVKNASRDNLLPVGGGAFLNEIDGNLTLWSNAEGQTTLHWQGKFRGPEFDPMAFELKGHDSDKVIDSDGRPMPSVVAAPMSDTAVERGEARQESDENLIMKIVAASPRHSLRGLAEQSKLSKSTVERMLKRLANDKFMTQHRNGKYKLTEKGKKEIGIVDRED